MKTGDGGTQWLQIRASSFGLCNVMTKDKLDAKARPTLRESMGYKKLIEKRNEMVFGAGSSGDALFGDAPPRKSSRLRRRSLLMTAWASILMRKVLYYKSNLAPKLLMTW